MGKSNFTKELKPEESKFQYDDNKSNKPDEREWYHMLNSCYDDFRQYRDSWHKTRSRNLLHGGYTPEWWKFTSTATPPYLSVQETMCVVKT